MLKTSLHFKNKFHVTREFLELGMQNLLGIGFIWTQTYKDIFKSALA